MEIILVSNSSYYFDKQKWYDLQEKWI